MANALKVYSYAGCSTCRKALGWLEKRGTKAEVIDITTTPPSKAELQSMLQRYEGQVKKLFNTSGQVYREQKVGEKLAKMSEKEALELLAGNGRLVKRPFVVRGKEGVVVGFREEEWKKVM